MATHYQYHGSWYIQWSEKGERKREVVGRCSVVSEREAKLRARAKELELATGKVIYTGVPSLSEFIPEYLNWYEREYPSSIFRIEQIVKQHLEPEFGMLPMDYIKTKRVEDYKHKRLADGAKPATVVKELQTLKAMLNRAIYWDVLQVMPFKVEGPKQLDSKPPLFYTAEQLASLYSVATPEHAPIWRLYANTGMRRMEGLTLRHAWIGVEGMKILSSPDERTKSGKWREIPLTEGAKEALEAIPKAGEHVLPRIRPESLSRACLKDSASAGLEGGLHTLRHTYASHLVMAEASLRTVQTLLGHANIKTTEIYAHLSPGYLQEQGRRISL